MPMSSMDWGHCRHRAAYARVWLAMSSSSSYPRVRLPTSCLRWPRCGHGHAYTRIWLATSLSCRLRPCLAGHVIIVPPMGVGCFASQWGRGGLGGSEVVDWCGVAEMEGGSQVSGGVETVIKTRYETQLSSCLISRRTTWASHFLGPPWCFPPGSLRRAMLKRPTSLW